VRTENYKHGVVSIILVFALVFSMISITSFASSGNLISTPTDVSVLSGGTFVISNRLVWNQVENGSYIVTIYWEAIDNKPEENFTFLGASAYFDNLDSIEASVTFMETVSPYTGNLLYTLGVRTTTPDPRDGEFNVDITLSASGAGGAPHIAGDHLIQYSMIVVTEAGMLNFYPGPVTVHVGAWLSGIAVKGRANCFSDDQNPPPAFIMYETGDLPPIGIGERYNDDPDNGAVFAWAGSSTCRNGKWNIGTNPDPHLDELFHAVMQWMVPGAENVLWYEGHNVYIAGSGNCSELVTALGNLGYTITFVSTEPITPAVLAGYNIVIMPGLQHGEWYTGGDPTLLLGSEVDAMVGFVESGGGLIVMEFADYGGQFMKVQNKILKGVGFDWCFQSDTLFDTDNYDEFDFVVDVDNTTTVGAMYQNATGKTTVGLYSPSSLTPWPTPGVTVDITPDSRSAENGAPPVTYTVTVTNTGDVWDNFALSASDVPFNWNPTLDKDSTGFIENNTSTTATLSVTIPGDAVHCNLDTITVTATSYWDDTVSGSDTCTAHCTVGIKVDVEMLEPILQEMMPCGPETCVERPSMLYYKVAIKNIGVEDDSYDVTISDNAGWSPGLQVETMELPPTDDSYVSDANPTTNYGSVGYLRVGNYRLIDLQRTFLKFDLSSVPGEILDTKLYLYHYYSFDSVVNTCVLEDDAWTEGTVTWDTQPTPIGAVLHSEDGQTRWYIADLGVYGQVEQAGDGVLSVAVMADDEAESFYYSAEFSSKETTYGDWQKPYLEVTYSDLAADPITSTQVSVPALENKIIDICVHIPDTARPLEDDIITVEAVSQTNPDVSDSDTATAHAALFRDVEMTITPPDQDGYRDPLTYIVEIHNIGILNDKYNLSAYDELGWPLHIEPQEIWLKPCHTAQAALSVTIPAQTEGCTEDTITVEVVGNLASGSITDPEDADTSATVTAHCIEVLGVDVEVYPSIHQTGHPGSRLTWLVTVTNTGNVSDNYNLSFSQYVYDKVTGYIDWDGSLETTRVELGQGEEASILLNLDIPGDLRTCVQNEITVEVISETDEMISDTASVEAQVLELKPRIPQGEIQLQAVAGIVAIDIWPTEYDFGVFNEMDARWTEETEFTIRNVGNVDVEVWIEGTDAVSKPGEPAAKWTLGDGVIGVDTYAMWRIPADITVTTDEKQLTDNLVPHDETYFGLKVQAPSTFTAPAKMWMKVLITARKIHYPYP